jgi:hypothetical protein
LAGEKKIVCFSGGKLIKYGPADLCNKDGFMSFDNNKSSQRQRTEESVELLRRLREKLLCDDISAARVAALNLSWKQEDGLAILTEALFGNHPRTAKKAAAYGLRRTNGRMRKMALEVLEQGLKHRNRTTQAACVKSIALMKGQVSDKGQDAQVTFGQGETDMGDKGKRDKSRREQQKKAQLSLKEKRKLKREKRNK